MIKAFEGIPKRKNPDLEDVLGRDPFLKDIAKVLESKGYRRLDFKAQVFCSPENPHIRTRKNHTEEVIGNSVIIAQELGLNVNLCLAIATAHDIGHTPYGHPGERILTKLGDKKFRHEIFGTVVAQEIERKGKGLNLTYEVLQGITRHSRGSGKLILDRNQIQEFNAVMYADKISYVTADLNDAIRQFPKLKNNLPDCAVRLGHNQREKRTKLITDLIHESLRKGYVSLTEGQEFEDFEKLRDFLYKEVYPKANTTKKFNFVLENLHEYFSDKKVLGDLMEHYSKKSEFDLYLDNSPILKIDPTVAIALLTDHEADHFYGLLGRYDVPPIEGISEFGVFEILPYLHNRKIDYSKADLNEKDFIFPT